MVSFTAGKIQDEKMQYLIEKLPDYSQGKVIIYGDVMLDCYWHGGTERMSFEAPVPIVDIQHIEQRPGGAANVAVNLAGLGVQVDVYGMVGHDDTAEQLQDLLQTIKINHHFLQQDTIPTTTKLRIISRHQQLLRVDFEEMHSEHDCAALQQQCCEHLSAVDVLVLSDYAKGVISHPQPLIKAAKQHGVITVIDPKKSSFEAYRGATVVTPNFKEFQAVVGECFDETTIIERGMLLLQRYDIQALLITRGAKGMTLLQKEKVPLSLPSQSQQIYDVTGAGDTVIALLAAGLAVGQSLEETTAIANVAAGLAVAKLGTATAQISELQAAIDHAAEYHHILHHSQQLLSVLMEQQRLAKRIVLLVGYFDILTLEHVNVLNYAKQQGDCLFVAVFDDTTVEKLTQQKPIHTVFERQAALAGLASVNWVFSVSISSLGQRLYDFAPDVLLLTDEQRKLLPTALIQYLLKDQKVDIQPCFLDEKPQQSAILQALQGTILSDCLEV